MALLRLDRFLADTGCGTRSRVKELAKKGRVSVNGSIIKKTDIKIDTDKDEVCLDGNRLEYLAFEYYMLYKPAGVVSATVDEKDKTVIELILDSKRRDLFPVGRLDKDTEGLLLITNDGKLSNNLLAPGKHVEKTYYAKLLGRADDTTIRSFLEGVDIGDERLTEPARLVIISNTVDETEVEITITEGRYHQIKRMFEACGMKVKYLKRLKMGSLKLDESLKPGEYRKLTEEELELLRG